MSFVFIALNHLLVTFTQFFYWVVSLFISISKSFLKSREIIPLFLKQTVNVFPSFSFAFDVTYDVFCSVEDCIFIWSNSSIFCFMTSFSLKL